ncbi:MAG: solute-binding protein [Desulfobacterales bacterium]|nr:solute-binding protein [Desulfobacterales bacterium]
MHKGGPVNVGRKNFIVFVLILSILSLAATAWAGGGQLMMATTTSTDNTGLLDYLIPEFIKETGIELKWVATGTGKALKLGQNCDVDVLMVHAPPAEKKYVANGFGMDRREIMYNDFVIIGPAADPAGIKGRKINAALAAVKAKKAVFVSRGDNSGTNKKEKLLWKAAAIQLPEKERWYVQTGQGMLATINVTAERGGYTMTDRGTYIKYEANLKGNPPLKILVEGDAILLNQYSVMTVNPGNCKNVKVKLAGEFADWMTSASAQKKISDFRLMGKQLFTPNAK